MPIKCLLAMSRLVPLEEGEETGNADSSAHNVVHIGCVGDYVSPMIVMFWDIVGSDASSQGGKN
jgi:hypothetical protein